MSFYARYQRSQRDEYKAPNHSLTCCSLPRPACARTQSRASHSAPVVTLLGQLWPKRAHMTATAKEHHAKISLLAFPTQACPQKCCWSISKLIISWFLTQQPYQEEPCSSHTGTEPNTTPVLLTDSIGVPRASAQRQTIVLPPYRNFLIGRPTNLKKNQFLKVWILLTVACCLNSMASLDILYLKFNKMVKSLSTFSLTLVFKTF